MNIKRRLEAMENKVSGGDYMIVFFRTVFEAKDGGVEGEIWNASIVNGPHAGAFVKRHYSEAIDAFKARCQAVSQGEIGPEEMLSSAQGEAVSDLKNNGFDVVSAMEKGQENE